MSENDNAPTLEEQLNQIIDKAEEKTNSEVEESTSQPDSNTDEKINSEIKEGDQVPSEIEEELKNVDPELKEFLIKADPDTRKAHLTAFNKMRAGFDKKQTEFGNQKKIAEAAQNLLTKYGLNPEAGFSKIEKLIQFEEELKNNPKEVISFLQSNFVQNGGNPGSDIDIEQLSQEEKYLLDRIKNIESSNQKLVRENRDLQELRSKQERDHAYNELVKFREAKNEEGNLSHPYFDEVIPDIEKLIPVYPNYSLAQIYSLAIRTNDRIFEKSLNDIREKERKQLEKEQKTHKANSINSQTLKSSSDSSQKKSLDDILMDIINKY